MSLLFACWAILHTFSSSMDFFHKNLSGAKQFGFRSVLMFYQAYTGVKIVQQATKVIPCGEK